MIRKIALSLCFTLFLGLLTACSPDDVLRLNKNESKTQKTQNKTSSTVENGGIGAPVAIPPRFGDTQTPPPPGTYEKQAMPNGLPTLQPMKGVNVDTLFAQELRDTDKRFDRVEDAVVDLRNEFDVYKPAIVRLAAVEADIQNLIKELEVVLQETPAQQPPLDLSGNAEPALNVGQLDPAPKPPPKVADAPKTSPPQQQAKKKPPTAVAVKETPPPAPKTKTFSGSAALNFRVGEHADKVRLAFDANKKITFNIDIDNDEKLLIVEIPDARWEGKDSQKFANSKLLESMSVESIGENGTMLIITLKRSAQILQKKILSPDKSSGYYRAYFDLTP